MISEINQIKTHSNNYGFRSEEQRLRENCVKIRAHVAEKYGTNCSAYKLVLKQMITEYLERTGTPVAEKILIEYQSSNFNNIS